MREKLKLVMSDVRSKSDVNDVCISKINKKLCARA